MSKHQIRWVQFLQEFDFEIEYKPGKWNTVADVLSRQPDYQHCTCGHQELHVILEIGTEWCKDLPRKLETDRHFGNVYCVNGQNDPLTKELEKQAKHLERHGDLLYFKKNWLYIPENGGLRLALLQECHDTAMAGHLGWEKTYECLQ